MAGKKIPGKRPIKMLYLVTCAYCSCPIDRWNYQLKESVRHFCNAFCKGKFSSLHKIADKACNWKGGVYSTIARTLTNSRYRRIRALVIEMDNTMCQLCHSSKKLEVHHIIEKGKNPALIYDITNLITLCKKCHCHIMGNETEYVGIFNEIVANRMNSGKARTANPEPSVQSHEGAETTGGQRCP